MLAEPTDQNQIFTSTFSYPGVLHWDLSQSTTRREAPFLDAPLTVIDQNTIPSSRSITAQCNNTFHISALPPSYPTLSACLVQATPSNLPDQLYILAPCYLDASQVYYNDQNNLGPPMAEEFWQCQQAYGSVSCSENQASSLHPEMVMALQEIQPMNIQTPFSTSPIYWPTSTQTMPDTSLQVVERETTLGLTPSGQTLCLLQSPDLGNACTKDAQMKAAPVSGDRSLIVLMHSPSEFLALTPAPNLEKTQKNNADEMNAEQSTPLNSYEGTKCNQDASPLPSAYPGMQQPLKYSDAGSLRQKLASQNATLENSGLGLEEPEALQSVMESSNDFADKTTLVEDIHLPQLLNFNTGLDQMEDHTASQTKDSKDIRRDQAQSRTSISKGLPEVGIKKNQKVSDVFHGALQARTHHEDILKEDDPGTIDNVANHLQSKSQVFHPLGKKSERKTGISSSRALLNCSSNKDPRTGPTTTSLGDVLCEGRGPGRIPGNAQKTESSAPKRYPSLTLDDLSPPGKVKLVPLPFLALDKPQDRPVSRKLHCLASHRPTTAYPERFNPTLLGNPNSSHPNQLLPAHH
ncbi:hypothetical protein LTLLF_206680 [Microtus ochrogaster]|uniref:Uncharacterized protein n=1 Tax=Microtus ochrogaster TaxID=79684 RepID=A0A8J6KZF0_MICOH|nr:hypothetical protein LTLLF_206680 [Microtus ochrogaster]